jgi:hypothetical protein
MSVCITYLQHNILVVNINICGSHRNSCFPLICFSACTAVIVALGQFVGHLAPIATKLTFLSQTISVSKIKLRSVC